jgi:Esterase-like activity of phytase
MAVLTMHRLMLVLLTMVACATPAQAAEPPRLAGLALLDMRVLSADDIGGQRPSELSGLAWDHDEAQLYAVTDRGRLFRFAIDIAHGRIAALVPLAGGLIGGVRRPDAEALWLRHGRNGRRGDGELVLADESALDALVIDLEGRPKASEPLPEALRDRERWHDASSGIEALAWHGRHGLMAALQRPLRGSPPGVHHVHAGSGRSWASIAYPGGRSSIKAIEPVDEGRLLVLEKVKLDGGHLTVLRELRLDGCAREAPCDAPAALLRDSQLLPDDNFEGMACVDVDLCLLVTDSGGSSAGRTLIALVRITRQ